MLFSYALLKHPLCLNWMDCACLSVESAQCHITAPVGTERVTISIACLLVKDAHECITPLRLMAFLSDLL